MPLRNVAEYLERSAARVPDKTAFSDAAGAVSYRQMLHDAQALGTVLAGLPGCRNAPVAVMIGRTAASVTAMQGVLQSGCYYVPIDEQMPEARMRSILGQVHARAIVHTAANEPQARALADCAPLVSLEEASQHTPDEALLRARREEILDIDPVYVLFTSGSTGTPKGIVIPHRAILDFTAWMTEFCGYTEDEVFGNQAPFYFDLSGKDVYQTLSLGASCRIFEKKYFTFPMLLLKAMEETGVTAINWATSAFHLVAASGALTKYAPTHLKKAALGGEALQARYVNLWKAAVPGLQVVNMYGPTETTIDCAAMHLTREYRDDEPIPIGRACRNKQIILLKDDLTEAQPGEPGEICVRGSGVAAGYLQTPPRRTRPSSRTRSAPISATSSTAPAIWPCCGRTDTSTSSPAATGRSSTWATASSWARSRSPCTASPGCRPPPASMTRRATAFSASTRAAWSRTRWPRTCGSCCPNTCCRTSMKSSRPCPTTPTARSIVSGC